MKLLYLYPNQGCGCEKLLFVPTILGIQCCYCNSHFSSGAVAGAVATHPCKHNTILSLQESHEYPLIITGPTYKKFKVSMHIIQHVQYVLLFVSTHIQYKKDSQRFRSQYQCNCSTEYLNGLTHVLKKKLFLECQLKRQIKTGLNPVYLTMNSFHLAFPPQS